MVQRIAVTVTQLTDLHGVETKSWVMVQNACVCTDTKITDFIAEVCMRFHNSK